MRPAALLLAALPLHAIGAAPALPMCELMKSQEVAALSPFTLPLVKAEGWPMGSSPGGCRYVFEAADGSDRAAITIGVTALAKPGAARTHLDNHTRSYRDLWQKDIDPVAGLGDKAVFGGEDNTGLKIIQQSLVADINMGGQFPDVGDDQKKAASLALGKVLMGRVSQLKLR